MKPFLNFDHFLRPGKSPIMCSHLQGAVQIIVSQFLAKIKIFLYVIKINYEIAIISIFRVDLSNRRKSEVDIAQNSTKKKWSGFSWIVISVISLKLLEWMSLCKRYYSVLVLKQIHLCWFIRLWHQVLMVKVKTLPTEIWT